MFAQGRVYLCFHGYLYFQQEAVVRPAPGRKPDATDFGKEIILIDRPATRVSYQYDGYWTDIGNIYSFFEANLAYPGYSAIQFIR